MGIRGLRPALLRYGVLGPLSGESVVIDGPALVHRVLEACIYQRQTLESFACHPSYSTLGRLLISYLEELGTNNVIVRKIYFDGYLPPSKWPVRQHRVRVQSRLMKEFSNSFPAGSARLAGNVFSNAETGVSFLQQHFKFALGIPKPPFLVPGVLEILKANQKWGPLVEVVPGEADMYCAEYARQHGGIVLTADSDLFVTDLGKDGAVSFFSDVAHANPTSTTLGLTTLKFSLRAINDILQMDRVGGLCRVAFDMEKHESSFTKAKIRAQNIELTEFEQSEFSKFMREFKFKKYLPEDHPIIDMLSSLDARVAEMVVQALTLDGTGAETRGPRSLSMFLPLMIEDRSRKSAWYMSAAVRELAYGVLQRISPHPARTVIEYRLLDGSDRLGRRVDVPEPEELDEQCSLLASTLKQIAERVPSDKKHMLWLAFAISQDILWSKLEQRTPLSTLLIDDAERTSDISPTTTADESDKAGESGESEEPEGSQGYYDWDIIQFTARVQAVFYSLRMAKQFVEVVVHLSNKDNSAVPESMMELHEQLKDLPSIAEWPLLGDMSSALAAAREAKVLATVKDILGLYAVESEDAPSSRQIETKKQRRKAKDHNNPQPVPSNRFAALTFPMSKVRSSLR